MLFESNKNSSATAVLNKVPDFHKYAAECLNYAQSIVIMCLIKESNFKKICNEIKTVDPSLDNSFSIKLELNWLCLHNYIKKIGNNYKLIISNETVQQICSKVGFEKILQQ